MYAFWVISSQEIVPVVKRKYPSHPALPHKSGVECENDHGALPSGSRAAQSMRAHDRTMRVHKKKNIAVEMVFFSILYKLLLFLHRCCLNPCPYTQNTFHTISTLLQCRCSGDDVWRFASFVCESCSLEELANLIRIFIHWTLWGRKHKERVYTVTLAFFFNACQVLVSFCSGPAAGFVSSMTCTLKGLCVWNLARSS